MKIRYMASKIKMAVFILGSLFASYAMLGFYALPALVKAKLPALIQQETGRKASFSTFTFDPLSLQLHLRAFALQEPDGQPFAGFDDFFIDINAMQSIRQMALVIDKVALTKPVVRIAKHKDGSFNFKGLLKEKSPTKQDNAKVFPLTIALLSIADGKLDWQDGHLNSIENETAYPINLTLTNLTTLPGQQSSLDVSLALSSGGTLDWKGSLGLSPLSSSGHIRLDKMPLPRIKALALQDAVQQDLQGHAVLEAHYKASFADSKANVYVNQGTFEILEFQMSQEKALVKIPKLSLLGIDFDLDHHKLAVKSIAVNGADVKTGLNADGVFNFQPLAPTAKTVTDQVAPQKTLWDIVVNNIELNNLGLSFEDLTLKKPVTMTAKPINFKVDNFSNKVGSNLPFQFNAVINGSGSIKLDGNAILQPLSVAMAVEIKDIALEHLQPYVDRFLRLDIIDGRLATDGKVLLAKSPEDQWGVKFTGNSNVADLLTRDQLKNKDLIKWENLTLSGIDVDSSTHQYNADSLVIEKPYVRVVIRQDKTVNFKDILITDKSKTLPVPEKAEPVSKPTFKLGKIQIIEGSSDFADLSLILPFAAQIKSLDGGASGISSEQKSTIKLALKGNAYDLAPVDIKGEISPYLGNYNVLLNFTGMPMPLISSYMVQFAGYKVEKGKMSLELDYQVAHKELTASNTILIDQFELGEKVENPKAVSLPLALAVALMKDSDGKIKIHVPISGSLENPQFSIKHLVVDALVNAITKVVTSPFRTLASLINSEEDLSSISFEAGSATLNKSQTNKLDDLAKALKSRSNLKLEIKGAVFKGQDWPAISDDALYDQLKRIKAAEINKQGGRKTRAEYVVISDQDYRRLMEQLFVEKFPLLVEKSLLGTPRLIDSKAGDFYEVAKQKLSAIIVPETQRLKDLATERAQAIANYIVQKGGIANDRVFILDTVIDPDREGQGIASLLSLNAE